MKNQLLFASLLSLLLLQACGGGGGGGGAALPILPPAAGAPPAAPPAPPPANADAGSVSAPFMRGSSARYQLLSVGSQSFGNLTQSEQAASGAMTRLNETTLSGTSATKDIAGDASFAIGRWTAGTVTRSSGAETLTGQDNRAYHYLAFNNLATLPTSGAATCDAGVFTAPTYVSGTAGANSGSASGSAGLVFDGSGATVSGSIKVVVGDQTGSANLGGTIASTTSTAITGAFLSGGTGAALQLGDHSTGAYLLGVGYAVTLPGGGRYQGIVKFRCA